MINKGFLIGLGVAIVLSLSAVYLFDLPPLAAFFTGIGFGFICILVSGRISK